MRKFLIALTSLAVAAGVLVYQATPSVPAHAQLFQFNLDDYDVNFVSMFSDDDVSAGAPAPAIWFKYVGTEESGTVDLDSDDINFEAGPLGSLAAPASGDIDDVNRSASADDVCGTTRGQLTVTNAACDTPAELVNVINDAQNNVEWLAVLGATAGDETLATATEYSDPADANAKLPGGLAIFLDHSDVDSLYLLMRPDANDDGERIKNGNNLSHGDIEFFLQPSAANSYLQVKRDNPFAGQQFALTGLVLEADTTLVWDILIYARRYQANGRVSDRLLFSRIDLTVDASTEEEFNWLARSPLITEPGETILIRIRDDALVTGRIAASGFFFRKR